MPRQTIAKINVIMLLIVAAAIPAMFLVEKQERQAEETKFTIALQAADAGRWYWSLDNKIIEWDKQMYVLFGITDSTAGITRDTFFSHVHPSDVDAVKSDTNGAIDNKTGYAHVYRIVTDTGELRYLKTYAKVSVDGTFMAGVCIPATQEEYDLFNTTLYARQKTNALLNPSTPLQ